MTDEKKNIVVLAGKRIPSEIVAIDAEQFFRHPETLEQHINSIAQVDANSKKNDLEKPVTKVSSLASFQTSSTKSSFAFKKTVDGTKVEQDGNVRIFGKPDSDKSRKK